MVEARISSDGHLAFEQCRHGDSVTVLRKIAYKCRRKPPLNLRVCREPSADQQAFALDGDDTGMFEWLSSARLDRPILIP